MALSIKKGNDQGTCLTLDNPALGYEAKISCGRRVVAVWMNGCRYDEIQSLEELDRWIAALQEIRQKLAELLLAQYLVTETKKALGVVWVMGRISRLS